MGCTACHAPHAGDAAGLLVRPRDTLCQGCHARMLEARLVHRHHPFAQGACLECHAAHGDAPALARETGAAACARCHAGVIASSATARSRHAPFEAGACTFCHDPHGSGEAKDLRVPAGLLCLGCHPALRARLAAPGAVVHLPARAGACLECHRSHSAPEPRLLGAPPPALCARCHDLDATPFRAIGGHGPHADCTRCHDPHAGGAHLLRERTTEPATPRAPEHAEKPLGPPSGGRSRGPREVGASPGRHVED
jgi:predicted CXXCH cytochrome family protein